MTTGPTVLTTPVEDSQRTKVHVPLPACSGTYVREYSGPGSYGFRLVSGSAVIRSPSTCPTTKVEHPHVNVVGAVSVVTKAG